MNILEAIEEMKKGNMVHRILDRDAYFASRAPIGMSYRHFSKPIDKDDLQRLATDTRSSYSADFCVEDIVATDWEIYELPKF